MPDSSSLVFLGDVACPHGVVPQVRGIDRLPGHSTVLNLEGALCAPGEEKPPAGAAKGVTLYNSTHALAPFEAWNVRAVSLANNHILDAAASPQTTIRRLADAGIAACGAGDNAEQAAAPALISLNDIQIVLVAFGWEVIECQDAKENTPGVNPLRPRHVLDSVARLRAAHRGVKLVALMHWDYELERFPLPAHRQLAHDLLAHGADAVIGHHPHCVQGIEWAAGKPIAYSLGNWFLPQGDWFGGPIAYPDYAARQLALAWSPTSGHTTCHWFDYRRDDHSIQYLASEPARESAELKALTPFAGMSHGEYVKFFRRHRVKSRGLPIYRDYRHAFRNRLFDRWNTLRMRGIRWLRGRS
jgi:poly-gamma-glutamate synthesis protein (capsule biosynthesis protein)